ncbi:hypothetical protein [Pedobacter heparinus]|uniref:ATP-grasp domain-containing protein n=1 Tax=Pedobacter heparinus TaxID=984 RepID=UPI0029300FF8|nr:hypothetical protein [Pedobacter heparinus]
MKIAFISYQIQERYSAATEYDEDTALLNFLLNKGVDCKRMVWNEPDADWQQFDMAVIKSPWDYHENFTDFNNWLNNREAEGLKLLNSYQLIRWNSDKHYLKKISDAGFKIIPSLFLEKNTRPFLVDFFGFLAAQKLIIKPCVSAGAKNTLIIDRDNLNTLQEEVYRLLQAESYMVQPFMEEVREGEWSFLFFNGKYSHSLLKVPKSGDFRVQQFFGGNILETEAPAEHIKAAQSYIDHFAKDTFYARVDGLIVNGELVLMELELIEPYLYLNNHSKAMENYYQALLQHIK